MNSTLLLIFALLSLSLFKERNVIDGKATSNDQIQVSESEQNKINALKRGKETYTVEIFVFVDHASYKKWYKLAGQDKTKALSYIKLYFAHVIDEARKVYETVDLPGIWITCDLIGYYIAEDSTALGDYSKAVTNYGKIKSDYALSLLRQWIANDWASEKPITPRFDLGVIFTGDKMVSGAGYGYLSSACTVTGINIVEDSSYFFTLHTTVHEIGHNLGLHHDGQAGCNDDDSYIMSATKLGLNKNNLFKFSRCSIPELRTFFNKLKSENNNCLLNKPSTTHLKNLKMLPGLQYNYDEQCKIYYGESSALCRNYFKNEQDYSKMCQSIYCWNPEENACSGLTPADGSSCGDNKWCMRENCVYDSRAPIFNITPDVNIPEIVECREADWCPSEPFVDCYQMKDTCCQTCKKKYNPSKKGCEYGDRVSWCKKFLTRNPGNCNDQDIRTKCCQSCE